MKIRLVIPDVNAQPTDRPRTCRWCGHWRLHRHGLVLKPVTDHRVSEVVVERCKCIGCGRTFQHYPAGVMARAQSQRTGVLAALLYGFGLSCAASAAVLSAFWAGVSRMSVWRDAQVVGEVLRQRRPASTVRVLGADETVFRVRGTEVLVGFVVDAQQGQTLGFEVLSAGEARAFVAWLRPSTEAWGVEVLVSDGDDTYGVVASELGRTQQLCLAHMRKTVARQRRSLRTQVRDEQPDEVARTEVEADLDTIRTVVTELPEHGLATLWRMHQRYLAHPPPRTGEHASVGEWMRMLSLQLIEQWDTLRLAQTRPELGLDGTNNVTERAIGKSKLR